MQDLRDDFLFWLHQLRADARLNGCSRRTDATVATIWFKIFLEGVEPNVRSILAWCLADPERFADLRETEKELSMANISDSQLRMAA